LTNGGERPKFGAVAFVLLLFAAGCLVAAFRWADDGVDRAFYWGCCALTGGAALSMIQSGHEFAYRLAPNPW